MSDHESDWLLSVIITSLSVSLFKCQDKDVWMITCILDGLVSWFGLDNWVLSQFHCFHREIFTYPFMDLHSPLPRRVKCKLSLG